jgi:hypothetical protein
MCRKATYVTYNCYVIPNVTYRKATYVTYNCYVIPNVTYREATYATYNCYVIPNVTYREATYVTYNCYVIPNVTYRKASYVTYNFHMRVSTYSTSTFVYLYYMHILALVIFSPKVYYACFTYVPGRVCMRIGACTCSWCLNAQSSTDYILMHLCTNAYDPVVFTYAFMRIDTIVHILFHIPLIFSLLLKSTCLLSLSVYMHIITHNSKKNKLFQTYGTGGDMCSSEPEGTFAFAGPLGSLLTWVSARAPTC